MMTGGVGGKGLGSVGWGGGSSGSGGTGGGIGGGSGGGMGNGPGPGPGPGDGSGIGSDAAGESNGLRAVPCMTGTCPRRAIHKPEQENRNKTGNAGERGKR